MANYAEKFNEFMHNLLVHHSFWNPIFFVTQFVDGLRSDVRFAIVARSRYCRSSGLFVGRSAGDGETGSSSCGLRSWCALWHAHRVAASSSTVKSGTSCGSPSR